MLDSGTASRPLLALTMGDVAGIGPEVVVRAANDPAVRALCRPLIVGHPQIAERAAVLIGCGAPVSTCATPRGFVDDPARLACWNPAGDGMLDVPPGANDARAGRAAYDWLAAATRAALAGEVDGIVTAPLSKAALHLGGHAYPGHTEILAELCGVREFAMMLHVPAGGPVRGAYGLSVAHVTLHTSVRSVPDLLSVPRIVETIGLVHGFVGDLGCPAPRIGVCALNPHAGEEGLFGDEEARLVAPAVRAARDRGLAAHGPFPADTLLKRAVEGEFDGVAAMYHDQGHIALKLIAFDRAVNVTLGLPVVRTSPSHGTAFDIAWKGVARADGMVGAIRTAATLCAGRQAR